MGLHRFRGNERFEIRRELGSGTAGVVYEAWDRERERSVALKVLNQSDPAALYRFKQEFRALTHLQHPNLVELYELRLAGDEWVVSMELVDGVDFITWARRPEIVARGLEALVERLLPAARQLAYAVVALHAAGRLHRDVKPKNVLVDEAGHLRLLDFGLVTKSSSQQTFKSDTGDLLGTPAYMAPEQGLGDEISEATDWYAVGVLLYEALTGRTPFTGQFVQVMLAKGRREPPPPSRFEPGLDPDLDRLVSALLRRDPADRPSGEEVLRRLGAPYGSTPVDLETPPLVGREADLVTLHEAWAEVLGGGSATVWVHGAAGLGKTALVELFLDEAGRQEPETVILGGRCFEHESVPFKAFDSVIDALMRYLRSLPYTETAALLPDDVLILARLFPVLRRVKAIASARRSVLEIPDSRERRRRAFAALRELLGRIGRERPLIVFVDDLQWGDFDSAVLLTETFRPPQAPPLLFIGAYRDEDAVSSSLLQALSPGSDAAWPARQLEVAELDEDAARELALHLLGGVPQAAETAAKIVREAQGSARFVAELVRATHRVLEGGELSGPSAVRPLIEVLHAQTAELPAAARALLEVLAVAAQPLALEVARRVAELEGGEIAAVNALRLARLARSSGVKRGDRLEIYDDHIAMAVRAALAKERRRELHLCLARELEEAGGDSENLSFHFAAAGETRAAFEHAAAAAAEAADALAFDRAARLYRRALELAPATSRDEFSARLAVVLVSAGRGAEAAEIYQRLATRAPAAERLDMCRRAAEHWLVSGHIDRGLETLEDVLAAVGLAVAADPRRAGLESVVRRAILAFRGHEFEPAATAEIDSAALIRLDTCWSAAIGLALVDTARGALFQARHLELAQSAGDAYRMARALALEVAYSAAAGPRRAARTRHLIERVSRLTERLGHPHTDGLVVVARGLAAYLEGRFEAAGELLSKASEILRERAAGAVWELDNAHLFTLLVLIYRGEIEELRRRFPPLVQDARDRGDQFALMNFHSRISWLLHLADDDPRRAAAEIETASESWTAQGFHLQHLWCLMGRCEVGLYRGAATAVRNLLTASWPRVERSQFLRVALLGSEMLFLRARVELAAAAVEGRRANRLVRLARRLERQQTPWGGPLARLLRAGVAALRGESRTAAMHAAVAAEGFSDAGMALHAAAAHHRQGELMGGEAGREIAANAEHWMAERGIRSPARFAAWLAPIPEQEQS